MSKTPQWYAIRTRSNCEKRVSPILTEKGIENYLPVFHELHSWKDRKKIVEVPLFPGYLFALMVDCRQSRLAVLCSQGVVGILGNGEALEPIPEYEIQSVRQLLRHAGHFCAHPLLRNGAWVRVKRGALKGVEGLLVRMKSETRLVVSITLLSQSVSAEVDVRDVELLRPHGEKARQIA